MKTKFTFADPSDLQITLTLSLTFRELRVVHDALSNGFDELHRPESRITARQVIEQLAEILRGISKDRVSEAPRKENLLDKIVMPPTAVAMEMDKGNAPFIVSCANSDCNAGINWSIEAAPGSGHLPCPACHHITAWEIKPYGNEHSVLLTIGHIPPEPLRNTAPTHSIDDPSPVVPQAAGRTVG